MGVIFRQFLAEGGCNSFIVADEASRRACLIDPRADQLPLYESFFAARGLSPAYVIDTHTHADHYSGSHLVAQAFGARIAMGEHTQSARAGIKLGDGHALDIGGGLAVHALATPGHTPDSMSFRVAFDGNQLVFTGDTLFIGGSGRVDFPGADAGAQYDSIYKRIGALSGETWVFPGHDYSGLLFSTVACEKKTNPHWQYASREAFIRDKQAEALESSGVIPAVLKFNLDEKPRNTPRAGVITLCAAVCRKDAAATIERLTPEQWEARMSDQRKNALFVDVREAEEFSAARIEGVENIPLSELFLRWKNFNAAEAVYFMCDRGLRSLVAAETVRRLGLARVGDLNGGLGAWVASGRMIRRK